MKKHWIVRPYRKGDEGGIFSLFSSGIRDSSFRTEKWWNWRHRANPAGEAIVWVAEADGKIVSHLSSIPLKTKLGQNAATIIRGGDGKTIPEYRKQGIFTKLLLSSLEEGEKKGWSLFLSLPSEQLYPTLIKMGWLDVCKMPKFMKVLNPERFAQVIVDTRGKGVGLATELLSRFHGLMLPKRRKVSPGNDISVVRENVFDQSYDDFWERISRHIEIAVIRSSVYLTWRYLDNPSYQYAVFAARKNKQLLGFTVLGCYQQKHRIGRITEFLVLPGQLHVAELLLAEAENFFADMDVDLIECVGQNAFLSRTLYRKYGYIKRPFWRSNFAIKRLSTDLDPALLTAKENWLISHGESGIV